MSDQRLIIGYAHGGNVAHSWHWAMQEAILFDMRERKLIQDVIHFGGLYIDDNRHNIASMFLNHPYSKAPWLLSIDTDITFSVQDMYALVDGAKEPGVYSGVYFGPRSDGSRQIFMQAILFNRTETGWQNLGQVSSGVHRVDAVGMGFCLIHRSVFERMAERYKHLPQPWFHRDTYNVADGATCLDGEDMAFCLRCKEMGIPVYYNGDVIVTHNKSFPIGRETLGMLGVEMRDTSGFALKRT